MRRARESNIKSDSIGIDGAIEAFVRGFAFVRSFTHPYVPQRFGRVWVVRDAPRKNEADYRREEWIAHGVAPAEVDALARRHTRGRFYIVPIRGVDESDAPLREQYKALGYRLMATEPLMMHRLKRIARMAAPYPIERVRTAEMAHRLAKAVGRREMLPEHLAADAPLRQYVALDGEEIIGWVKSITVSDAGDATWVSNMHVKPQYRRRGIGKAMLARMLRDDRAAGAKRSVLTASHTGALLYPLLGYEMIGELLAYTPKK